MPMRTPPPIPDGMIELMKQVSKGIIKEQPDDIYEYAAIFFEKLLLERDGSLDKGYGKFRKYSEYCKAMDRLEGKRLKLTRSQDRESDSGVASSTSNTDDELTKFSGKSSKTKNKEKLSKVSPNESLNMEISGTAIQATPRAGKVTQSKKGRNFSMNPKFKAQGSFEKEKKTKQNGTTARPSLVRSNGPLQEVDKKSKPKPRKLSSKKPSESLIAIKEETGVDDTDADSNRMDAAANAIKRAFRKFVDEKKRANEIKSDQSIKRVMDKNAAAFIIQRTVRGLANQRKQMKTQVEEIDVESPSDVKESDVERPVEVKVINEVAVEVSPTNEFASTEVEKIEEVVPLKDDNVLEDSSIKDENIEDAVTKNIEEISLTVEEKGEEKNSEKREEISSSNKEKIEQVTSSEEDQVQGKDSSQEETSLSNAKFEEIKIVENNEVADEAIPKLNEAFTAEDANVNVQNNDDSTKNEVKDDMLILPIADTESESGLSEKSFHLNITEHEDMQTNEINQKASEAQSSDFEGNSDEKSVIKRLESFEKTDSIQDTRDIYTIFEPTSDEDEITKTVEKAETSETEDFTLKEETKDLNTAESVLTIENSKEQKESDNSEEKESEMITLKYEAPKETTQSNEGNDAIKKDTEEKEEEKEAIRNIKEETSILEIDNSEEKESEMITLKYEAPKETTQSNEGNDAIKKDTEEEEEEAIRNIKLETSILESSNNEIDINIHKEQRQDSVQEDVCISRDIAILGTEDTETLLAENSSEIKSSKETKDFNESVGDQLGETFIDTNTVKSSSFEDLENVESIIPAENIQPTIIKDDLESVKEDEVTATNLSEEEMEVNSKNPSDLNAEITVEVQNSEEKAAVNIQKTYRGYRVRRDLRLAENKQKDNEAVLENTNPVEMKTKEQDEEITDIVKEDAMDSEQKTQTKNENQEHESTEVKEEIVEKKFFNHLSEPHIPKDYENKPKFPSDSKNDVEETTFVEKFSRKPEVPVKLGVIVTSPSESESHLVLESASFDGSSDILGEEINEKDHKILPQHQLLNIPFSNINQIKSIEEISETSDSSDQEYSAGFRRDYSANQISKNDSKKVSFPNPVESSIHEDPNITKYSETSTGESASSELSETDEIKCDKFKESGIDETSRDERDDLSEVENFDFSSCGEDSLEAMYYSLRKNEIMVNKMHQQAKEQRGSGKNDTETMANSVIDEKVTEVAEGGKKEKEGNISSSDIEQDTENVQPLRDYVNTVNNVETNTDDNSNQDPVPEKKILVEEDNQKELAIGDNDQVERTLNRTYTILKNIPNESQKLSQGDPNISREDIEIAQKFTENLIEQNTKEDLSDERLKKIENEIIKNEEPTEELKAAKGNIVTEQNNSVGDVKEKLESLDESNNETQFLNPIEFARSQQDKFLEDIHQHVTTDDYKEQCSNIPEEQNEKELITSIEYAQTDSPKEIQDEFQENKSNSQELEPKKSDETTAEDEFLNPIEFATRQQNQLLENIHKDSTDETSKETFEQKPEVNNALLNIIEFNTGEQDRPKEYAIGENEFPPEIDTLNLNEFDERQHEKQEEEIEGNEFTPEKDILNSNKFDERQQEKCEKEKQEEEIEENKFEPETDILNSHEFDELQQEKSAKENQKEEIEVNEFKPETDIFNSNEFDERQQEKCEKEKQEEEIEENKFEPETDILNSHEFDELQQEKSAKENQKEEIEVNEFKPETDIFNSNEFDERQQEKSEKEKEEEETEENDSKPDTVILNLNEFDRLQQKKDPEEIKENISKAEREILNSNEFSRRQQDSIDQSHPTWIDVETIKDIDAWVESALKQTNDEKSVFEHFADIKKDIDLKDSAIEEIGIDEVDISPGKDQDSVKEDLKDDLIDESTAAEKVESTIEPNVEIDSESTPPRENRRLLRSITNIDDVMNPIAYAMRQQERFMNQMHRLPYHPSLDHGSLDEYSEERDDFFDEPSDHIKRNIFTSSISEADSDYIEPTNVPRRLVKDDFNISTALGHITSTDSDSTIVSAATKIQAGARGFLTRRRLRRSSAGTSISVDPHCSFGNAAIDKSLEDLVEQQELNNLDEAALKIQKFYRKYLARKRAQETVDYRLSPSILKEESIYVSDDSSDGSTNQYGIREIKLEQRKMEHDVDSRQKKNQQPLLSSDGSPENYQNIIVDDENSSSANVVRQEMKENDADRPKIHHLSIMNFDVLDTAQRRMTLQRGDAVQRNSTPEEIELLRSNSHNNTNNNSIVAVDDTKKSDDVTSNNAEVSATDVDQLKKYRKLLGPRQKSMPVQIDTEFMRIIPKHLRKRVKSAGHNNKRK